MNVIEIIRRKQVSSAEIIYVIQEYIKEKDGAHILINDPNNQARLQLMMEMYNTAAEYFEAKEMGLEI